MQARKWLEGALPAAVAAFVVGISGCGDLLGFESSVLVPCVRNSDCPVSLSCLANVCTYECTEDRDCMGATFTPGYKCDTASRRCVAAVTPIAPAADSGAVADAPQQQQNEGAVGSSEAEAGGDALTIDSQGCNAVCPVFAACRNSTCAQGQQVGPYGAGQTNVGASTTDIVSCVQVEVAVCGTVTGLGLTLAVAQTADVRMALYEDVGGVPTTRIAETDSVPTNGPQVDAPVTATSLIGCADHSLPYWICVASTSTELQFSAIDQSESRWTVGDATPFEVMNWVNSGLPDACPVSHSFMTLTPNIYLWMAQ